MGDNRALGEWIKKSLDAGDPPDIVKEALKNRGYDPGIVDLVLKSVNKQKEATTPKVAPVKEAAHSKEDAHRAITPENSPPEPLAESIEPPEITPVSHVVPVAGTPADIRRPVSNPPVTENNPEKKSLRFTLPKLPEFDFEFPKIHFGIDVQATRIIAVGLIFLIVLAAVFFGLNWYADQMAKAALG